MRKFIALLILGLVFLMVSGSASAASYFRTDLSFLPLLDLEGNPHPYSGPDIEETGDYSGVDLSRADFDRVWLNQSIFTGANFDEANFGGGQALLFGNDFTGASFRYATFRVASLMNSVLTNADMTGADLRTADLAFTRGWGSVTGSPLYSSETSMEYMYADTQGLQIFDPVAAGWTLVPEPNTALLLGFGLVGLGIKRRRRGASHSGDGRVS